MTGQKLRKDPPSFDIWLEGYNRDLCWVSCDSHMRPVLATRTVFHDYTHRQHQPVVIEVGLQIPLNEFTSIPRWNLGKAKGPEYSKVLDFCMRLMKSKVGNNHRFVALLNIIVKNHSVWVSQKMDWGEPAIVNKIWGLWDPEIGENLLTTFEWANGDLYSNIKTLNDQAAK